MRKTSLIIDAEDLKHIDSEPTKKKIIQAIYESIKEMAATTAEAIEVDIYPIEEKKLYKTSEVAAIYQISDRMVRKWCESKRIQAFRTPGGDWRIPARQFQNIEQVQEFQKVTEKINKRFQDSPEIEDFEK